MIISLIGNQQHRLLGTTQDGSYLLVEVRNPVHHIHHKQYHVGFVHRHQYLLTNLFFENIIRVHYPTASIYH